jgi:calcium-dependent protein kinase
VALFGSIDYVSPEALSRQDVSAASDMWSVGVILYILLSGYVGWPCLMIILD